MSESWLIKKLYGILDTSTGKFLTLSASSNGDDAEFCNDLSWELSTSGETPFLIENEDKVRKILSGKDPVEWYNSSAENPQFKIDYYKERLKHFCVVEVQMVKIL